MSRTPNDKSRSRAARRPSGRPARRRPRREPPEANRLRRLDREWDLETVVRLHAAGMAVAGVALGLVGRRRWFMVPTAAGLFLLAGGAVLKRVDPEWLYRRLGVRPREEIEQERRLLASRPDSGNGKPRERRGK